MLSQTSTGPDRTDRPVDNGMDNEWDGMGTAWRRIAWRGVAWAWASVGHGLRPSHVQRRGACVGTFIDGSYSAGMQKCETTSSTGRHGPVIVGVAQSQTTAPEPSMGDPSDGEHPALSCHACVPPVHRLPDLAAPSRRTGVIVTDCQDCRDCRGFVAVRPGQAKPSQAKSPVVCRSSCCRERMPWTVGLRVDLGCGSVDVGSSG